MLKNYNIDNTIQYFLFVSEDLNGFIAQLARAL